MWSWPSSSRCGSGTWTPRWRASNGERRVLPGTAGLPHLAQELLGWWEDLEAWPAPTPPSPQADLQPQSLASRGHRIWRDRTPACYRVPANFLNWQKTAMRNFIIRLVSWQDHGVQWLRVTTSCRVSSCKTMPYLVTSCDTVTCLFHIVFNHDTGVRHQSFLRRTLNCLRSSQDLPKKSTGPSQIQFGTKMSPIWFCQDPYVALTL